jgi:MIP family channel proteins
MSQQEIRSTVAEFIGTFMLVLVGAGAVAVSANNVVVAALAHGLILVAIIATFGHISGAHVNPAVTLGLLVGGKINLRHASFYWLAQFIGALLAGVILRVILPEAFRTTMGQTLPTAGVSAGAIILTEGLIAFFLVGSVYQAAVYGKGGNVAPLLIGLTLAAAILFAGPLTGASANPARTLGPAFLAKDSQDIQQVLYYFVGTFLGGLLAGFMHSDLFAPAGEPTTDKLPIKKRR